MNKNRKPILALSPMSADEYDPDGTAERSARYVISIERYLVVITDYKTGYRREFYTNDGGNTIYIDDVDDVVKPVVGSVE